MGHMYNSNKFFYYAILVSLVCHSLIFISLPNISFSYKKPTIKKLNIKYYKEKVHKKKIVSIKKKKAPSIIKKLPKIKKEDIAKQVKQKTTSQKVEIKKRKSIVPVVIKKREDVKPEKKIETVIKEEKDDAKKATYINYYQAVRERIRDSADNNYPKRANLGEGEVLLYFIVTSRGELIQVKIVDESSVDNAMLRKIALDSIRDANPFPRFPKGMDQYKITFNVIISFEANR